MHRTNRQKSGHLGLILQYQNIYDFDPVVPIDKLYNQFVSSIEVSF